MKRQVEKKAQICATGSCFGFPSEGRFLSLAHRHSILSGQDGRREERGERRDESKRARDIEGSREAEEEREN